MGEQETEGFRPAMPKALRPFCRHGRPLFSEVSRLIHTIITEFHAAAAGKPVLSGVIAVRQTQATSYVGSPITTVWCWKEASTGRGGLFTCRSSVLDR